MPSNQTKSFFQAAEVRRITGVTQRELDYWDVKGVVRASVSRARGKGVERKYSYTDLLKLRVVKELRNTGLSLQKIRKAIALLGQRQLGDDMLAKEILITDGVRLHRLTSDPAVLEDLLSAGQLSFSVLIVSNLERRIRRSITLSGRERAAV